MHRFLELKVNIAVLTPSYAHENRTLCLCPCLANGLFGRAEQRPQSVRKQSWESTMRG
jgi:hypothetical protein